MEAYPSDYIVHNLPLVLLCGLERETVETPRGDKSYEYLGDGGFRIRAELPPLHHPLTGDLRTALLSHDGSNAPWRPLSIHKPESPQAFKIRSVGRAYNFPPRKAPPPPYSPRLRPSNNNGISPSPLTLHSTLSPLSPSSPLYPDGIVTPHWITKHQYRLPSVLISFYNLVSDINISSLEDNKVKNEVNSIRTLIQSTNYKSKFIIVLFADGPINHTELEERLVNIRRGTNFDSKALYYLPSASSTSELNDFAKVLFSTVQPTCIEYYRDLSKHARRKRNRNSIPPPTIPPTHGTSSVLSLQGWNVRYEFKLGIFAETRQELDAAMRNYEQAYEGLFHPELLGEAIPAWSTRFNEARMLADVIAIRIIRCALWLGQSTTSVKWWIKHRDRARELIDRRGKGITNYGWEAWLSIWSKVMAELLEKSEVFASSKSQSLLDSRFSIQLFPQPNTVGLDRQVPWEHLHHPGYWLNGMRKHIETRRAYASQIPAEDRKLVTSTSIPISKKMHLYDTYLVPEPAIETMLFAEGGDNYSKRIADVIRMALTTFSDREQQRMVEMLELQRCEEYCAVRSWREASPVLQSLWRKSSWRHQGWHTLIERVGTRLVEVAFELKDPDLLLTTFWELAAIRQQEAQSPKMSLPDSVSTALDLQTCLSLVTPTFVFAADSGHVDEPTAVQMSLTYARPHLILALQIMEVKIVFDGGINPILMTANSSAQEQSNDFQDTIIQALTLAEVDTNTMTEPVGRSHTGTAHWSGSADLVSGPVRRIFSFELVPREVGPVSVASIILLLRNETHELTLNAADLNNMEGFWWEVRNQCPVRRQFGMNRDVTTITVLPKPPKVDIRLPGLAAVYYTNENIELLIEVINDEEEAIQGDLHARLVSPARGGTIMKWKHDDTPATVNDGEVKEQVLPGTAIDKLAPGKIVTYSIMLDGPADATDYELELKLSYVLLSNSATTMTKNMMVDLPIVRPFEASTAFIPRLHEEQWSDFFAAPKQASFDQPHGLKQKYLVQADLGCFATETLVVRSLQLSPRRIAGGAHCQASVGHTRSNTVPEAIPEAGLELLPEKSERLFFDLEMQKLVLGDRSPVAVELVINVEWSRKASGLVNTSTLILPKFLASVAEPRVLLQSSKMKEQKAMYSLRYTIENPSMHFLTFNVAINGSEGFAFSGSKLKTISLTPISRHDLVYHLYMQKSNEWVNVELEVLDAFFGQKLRVQPASDGVRVDNQGNVQVWSE